MPTPLGIGCSVGQVFNQKLRSLDYPDLDCKMRGTWKLFRERAICLNLTLLPPVHRTSSDYFAGVSSVEKFNYTELKIIKSRKLSSTGHLA